MKVWQARASETIRKGQECVVVQDASGEYFIAGIKKPRKKREVKSVQQSENNS